MDYCVFNFGGLNGTSAVSTVDAFKVSDEGIEKLNAQTLDSTRAYSAAASVGNCVVVVGGGTKDASIGDLDIFRFSGSTLEKAEDTSGGIEPGRNFLAAASVGNYVLAMGGCLESSGEVSSVFNTVDVFEVTSSSVAKVTDRGLTLKAARGRLAAATAGNRVIAVGGITSEDKASQYLDAFKLKTDGSFEHLYIPEALSVARYDLAAASVGNYVLAIGGFDGTNASNAVDVFRVNDNGVGKVEGYDLALSVPRYGLAAASVGNYILAMGGKTEDNVVSDVVDVFKLEKGGLVTVENHGLALKQARAYLSAASAGNYVLAMGGFDGTSDSKTVDVFYNFN